MAKINWVFQDEQGTNLNRYIATNVSTGEKITFDLLRGGNVSIVGTPLNAEKLNSLISAINDNYDLISKNEYTLSQSNNTITLNRSGGGSTSVTLSKSDISLGNVDNTSDATKKSNFTGAIASGNTGFVTGNQVYNENLKNVKISQGSENANKILVTDNNGNVTTETTLPDANRPKKYIHYINMRTYNTVQYGAPNSHRCTFSFFIITTDSEKYKSSNFGEVLKIMFSAGFNSDTNYKPANGYINIAYDGHSPEFYDIIGVYALGGATGSSISDDIKKIRIMYNKKDDTSAYIMTSAVGISSFNDIVQKL